MSVPVTMPRDVPEGSPIAVSLKSTHELNTGSWRTFKPLYVTRPSPCNLDCPAGTDVRAFLSAAASGDATAAWRTILEHNPLPATCGRVCYHPCESGCNRAEFDERVSIHAVERAVADQAHHEHAWRLLIEDLPPRSGACVAIVGAGPAGLSCAYQLARRGHQPIVFEAAAEPGGMLRYGIPQYRLPRVILNREVNALRACGVDFRFGARLGATLAWRELALFDAVFLAVGTQKSRAAGVPGEHLRGIQPALDFLRDVNAGRDVAVHSRVVVIGGGNTAIDAARVALRKGARVTVVYRRTRDEMPAHPDEVAQAEAEGVHFIFQAMPVRFQGWRGMLTSVGVQRTRPGAPDASGRSRPEPIPGALMTLACTQVLTAIGEELDEDAVGTAIEIAGGRVQADRWGRTSSPAFFAGGDAATGAGTVVEAIGSGRRAALAIDAWLTGVPMPADPARDGRVAGADLNLFYFGHAARVPLPMLHPAVATRGFDEVATGLTWDEAREEAARCLTCGSCTECGNCLTFCPDAAISRAPGGGFVVDELHCKGCGVCVAECPRAAMMLAPEEAR